MLDWIYSGRRNHPTQLYSTASYQAHDLAGIGLTSNDLTGGNFAGQNLTNASFSSATLSGADLGHANLTNAIFTSAKLAGPDLTGADMRETKFGSTTLKGFTAAHLYSTASYRRTTLRGSH